MGIFDGILLCSDMDGTLIDNKGIISKENSEAIKYFQENGGLFTVATGRRPEFPENFADSFVINTYIVALNGSIIYDPIKKEFVEKHPLGENVKSDIKKIMETFPGIGELQIHAEENLYIKGKDEDIDDFLAKIDERMFDIMFIQDKETTARLKDEIPKAFPGYKFCRGWPEGLEMFSANGGKGSGILKAKQLTGSRLVVSAGNYDNDTEMIKMADIGVCVSGSSEEVIEAADVVTVSCDESAIAVIIEELKKERPFK